MKYKFMPRNLSNLSQFKDDKSQMFLDKMTDMAEKTFIMDTIGAIKEEPFINNIDDYTARLDIQMANFVAPSGNLIDVASSWEKIAAKFYEYETFGQLFENESNYKKLLVAAQPKIDPITTPEGQIKAIYDFVNQNVAWRKDDFNLFGDSDNLNEAFEAKIANSGELNLMIFALLRHYKIESDLVAISTCSHGRPYIELPSEKQFDHVLVRAKANEKMYWLDAGNPLRPINTLRTESLNGLGWVTRPLNPEWIEIMPQTSVATINSNYKIGTDGSLKGTLTNIYGTYAAADFRTDYQENKGEALRKEWTGLFPSVVVGDFKVDNLQENVTENVKVNYTVTLPNSDNTADAQVMYLPVPMPSSFRENPFKAEKRLNDITFSYPLKHQYIVNLELPEGYAIESLPKGAVATLGENGGKFQYLTTQNGNNIQIVIKVQLQQLVFSPEEYKTVQDFYRLVADKFQEQIVLKKKI